MEMWLLVIFLTFLQGTEESDRENFNPVIGIKGDLSHYRNDPDYHQPRDILTTSLPNPPFPTNNLMNKADVKGKNAIIGLALYRNFLSGFYRLVGSLRHHGYEGHIILGVNPQLPLEELEFLKRNEVTLYSVTTSECDSSALNSRVEKGIIRGRCSKDIQNLKLEWGRYEMARRWLTECEECSGWSMIVDTRDIFFQADPFSSLEKYAGDAQLIFIEEIAPHSSPVTDPSRSFVCGNARNLNHIVPCYGHASYNHYSNRPVLNSGTVIGTRKGMLHFLSVLVSEFHENNLKTNTHCKSPSTTDQWTMNWLYYNGKFGLSSGEIRTIPWGVGPILTAGKACVTKEKTTGAADLIEMDSSGQWLINRFDREIAAGVHQFDRCYPWIDSYFKNKSHIFL